MTNSAMGLVSTFLNVYSIQDGQWSITAVITASIIGAWLVAACTLYGVYSRVLLPRLKATAWRAVPQHSQARGQRL
jgi:hypothetical protein